MGKPVLELFDIIKQGCFDEFFLLESRKGINAKIF